MPTDDSPDFDPKLVNWTPVTQSFTTAADAPPPIDPKMVNWSPVTPEDTPVMKAVKAGYKTLNLLNPVGGVLNMLGTGDPVQDAKNIGGGAIRGAGSIGATIVAPYDWATGQSNSDRRAAMDAGLQSLIGSDPNSALYKGGKLGGEIAGTAGAGPLIATGARALPVIGDAAAPLWEAIQSSGAATGLNPTSVLGRLGDLGIRSAGGAISGAAQAGLVDPSQAKTGAEWGGAIPAGIGLAKGLYGLGSWGVRNIADTVAPIINPAGYVGRGIARTMSPQEAAQAAQNIANAPTLLPGSAPTSAQVAGMPTLVQTEKAAGNLPAFKTAQMEREIANNQARWQALNQVAQTPEALAAAQTARVAATKPLYDAAHAQTAQVGSDYARYAANPDVRQAMRDGAAANATDVLANRTPVTAMFPEGSTSGRTINASAVDYTSRALGDMIGQAQRAGQGARAGSLTAIKNQIDGWMANTFPGMPAARAAYAAASEPINTMQVGQQIGETLGSKSLNAAGNLWAPQIQLGPYTSALRSAMGRSEYGVSPAAQQTLDAITQDLQRATVSNSVPKTGSDTAYNLGADSWLARQVFGSKFQGASMLGKVLGGGGALLSGHPYVAAGLIGGSNKLAEGVGSKLQGSLTNLLMNPAELAPYLAARGAAPTGPGLLSRAATASQPFLLRSAPVLFSGGQ
jgi:hypothetical protein